MRNQRTKKTPMQWEREKKQREDGKNERRHEGDKMLGERQVNKCKLI